MRSIKDLLIDSNSDKQSGHRYGFLYDLLFTKVFMAKGDTLRVLEIGVSEYGDGSLWAYAQSDLVARVVGVDVQPYPGTISDKLRFYEIDAYQPDTIALLKKLEGSFDIIIDDGTHREEHQAFFLEHYTELLADGGLLVCEDVTSVELINAQCSRADVFFFDGWGNREVQLQAFSDPKLYQHCERMLIKSKSEKLTDGKRHENKPHIARLPVVQFGDYERSSTELAISVPLFHPELDSYDADRFRDVHCKGAVWAALSLLKNSDLGERGVPVYFHIEDKVWDDAMPVFKAFGVPESWCRQMALPSVPDVALKVTSKPQFGKSWMGLRDTEIDPDVLLILDSDIFLCTTDKKFAFYEKLTSPILKKQPSMTYFQMREFPYYWWVSIILLASGLPDSLMYDRPIDSLEQEAYQRLGFTKEITKGIGPQDTVSHFYTEDYLMTFPRCHPARDYALSRLSQCYATPYVFSVWGEEHQPFVELDQILKIPVYDWEDEFIAAKRGHDCFSHIRVRKGANRKLSMPSRIHAYWDTFFQNVSRHVEV